MGLAPIRVPRTLLLGQIALSGPDGGQPHPYWLCTKGSQYARVEGWRWRDRRGRDQ
jgi:hypothetical protein